MKPKAYCTECSGWRVIKNYKVDKIGIGQKRGVRGNCPDCDKDIFILDKWIYLQQKWGR